MLFLFFFFLAIIIAKCADQASACPKAALKTTLSEKEEAARLVAEIDNLIDKLIAGDGWCGPLSPTASCVKHVYALAVIVCGADGGERQRF